MPYKQQSEAGRSYDNQVLGDTIKKVRGHPVPQYFGLMPPPPSAEKQNQLVCSMFCPLFNPEEQKHTSLSGPPSLLKKTKTFTCAVTAAEKQGRLVSKWPKLLAEKQIHTYIQLEMP